MFKTLADSVEQLALCGNRMFLARKSLAHGSEQVGQLCVRRGRSLDYLSEKSARIFWRSDSQLFLEATECADFIHEGEVAAEVAAE